MLERLRQNSRSLIIWILFGIIIATFIITFGPQSGSLSCGQRSDYAIRVDGIEVSAHSWRFFMNGLELGAGAQESTARHIAMDLLVERELLAQQAERDGFHISTDQVNEAIKRGDIYIAGQRVNGKNVYFPDGAFDYDALEMFVTGRLTLPSVPHFVEQQRRELLAHMMRERLMAPVTVSSEEARAQYVQDNTRITAEYVKFDVARYASSIALDDAELDKYIAEHDAEIRAEWDRSKTMWEKKQPWLLARHILIRKDATPTPDKPAPAVTAADRAKKVHDRVAAGEKFAQVAREASEDDRSKHRGGSLGWRPAGSLGWGNELVEAAKKLEPGKVSDVIQSAYGYHVMMVDERTDASLTYDKVKREIAATLAPRAFAGKQAKQAAEAALAAAKTKPLDQLFEKATEPAIPPGFQGQDIPPEILEQLEQQLQEEELAPPAESGWIYREGPTVPAQVGSEPAEPAAEPPPAGSPPAAQPPAAPQPPASSAAPAKPATDDSKPPLRTIGPVARFGDLLTGVGRSEELLRALFEEASDGEVIDRVFEVKEPDGFVVARLVKRNDADLAEYEKQADEIRAHMRRQKGAQLYSRWLRDGCKAAAEAGKVEVNRDYLYENPTAKDLIPYNVCQYLNLSAGN